jgi:ribosomal subunit interface protein
MLTVQITMRDTPNSSALDTTIRKKAKKLEQFYDRISSCRVVVERTQRHKHQGQLFNIRIDVSVPGKELVVTHKQNEDVYVALRDAFNAMTRQLEEHARKRHGRIKAHEKVKHGYVARIMPEEGYGFIEGTDGTEYYFSVTNVHYPDFEQLLVGDAVEYIPAQFDDGWQAHHILRERRNHYA